MFRFYCFLEAVQNNGSYLSVLSYNQPITKANAIGVRRTLRSRSFKGYLKEEERDVRAAEKNEIITILEACTKQTFMEFYCLVSGNISNKSLVSYKNIFFYGYRREREQDICTRIYEILPWYYPF